MRSKIESSLFFAIFFISKEEIAVGIENGTTLTTTEGSLSVSPLPLPCFGLSAKVACRKIGSGKGEKQRRKLFSHE